MRKLTRLCVWREPVSIQRAVSENWITMVTPSVQSVQPNLCADPSPSLCSSLYNRTCTMTWRPAITCCATRRRRRRPRSYRPPPPVRHYLSSLPPSGATRPTKDRYGCDGRAREGVGTVGRVGRAAGGVRGQDGDDDWSRQRSAVIVSRDERGR